MYQDKANDLVLISTDSSQFFAENLARCLGLSASLAEVIRFADGEFSIRPVKPVNGRRVLIVQSFHRDPIMSVGDKLSEVLFLCSTVKAAGAAAIILVAPYLCFGRSDRPLTFQGCVLSRSVAQLLEAVGVQCVITMDAHNVSAYHNAFRCRSVHISAARIFAEYCQAHGMLKRPMVVSPDLGGVKRCEEFSRILQQMTGLSVDLCVASKQRVDHVVADKILIGSVTAKDAIILDDMISTGATLVHAISACSAQNPSKIFIAATHGLFAEGAAAALGETPFTQLLLTNTVVPYQLVSQALQNRLSVLDAAAVFGAALRDELGMMPGP